MQTAHALQKLQARQMTQAEQGSLQHATVSGSIFAKYKANRTECQSSQTCSMSGSSQYAADRAPPAVPACKGQALCSMYVHILLRKLLALKLSNGRNRPFFLSQTFKNSVYASWALITVCLVSCRELL